MIHDPVGINADQLCVKFSGDVPGLENAYEWRLTLDNDSLDIVTWTQRVISQNGVPIPENGVLPACNGRAMDMIPNVGGGVGDWRPVPDYICTNDQLRDFLADKP